MAEGKKSVIVYTDWGSVFDKLTNEEKGVLIQFFFDYVRDKQIDAPDRLTELLFEPIKLQLKRDLKGWEDKKIVKAESGRLGGIKSGEARALKLKQKEAIDLLSMQNKANEANASNTKQKQANEPVNVTVTVNDNVNVKEGEKEGKITPPAAPTFKPEFFTDFKITISEIETEMLTDQYTQEQIAMKYHLPDIATVQKWIKEYILTQKCEGCLTDTLKDSKSHFSRWLKTQLQNGTEQRKTDNRKIITTIGVHSAEHL